MQKTKIINHMFLRASVKNARPDVKNGFNSLLLIHLQFKNLSPTFVYTMQNSDLLPSQGDIKLQHSQSGLKVIAKSTYYYKKQG